MASDEPPNPDRGTARVVAGMVLLGVVLLIPGLLAGGRWFGWTSDATILWQIRAPRSLGAWLTGALLGLAGAIAQGLFRNPLADPYLLGSAAGAGLGAVLVLAAGSLAGQGVDAGAAGAVLRLGLVGAACAGAWIGVALAVLVARGAASTTRLLLAGVVVGVLLTALADGIALVAPDTLPARQSFLLGSTGYLGWRSCATLALGLLVALAAAARHARALDALALGEDTAASLGIGLPRARLWLVAALAVATGVAVSQTGLIAFVGLAAPHLVRRAVPGPHRGLLLTSAGCGAVLLLAADVLARTLISPLELPVGMVTAVAGGGYLLWLLQRTDPR